MGYYVDFELQIQNVDKVENIVESVEELCPDLKKEDVHFTKDGEKIIYDKFTCENIVK